MNTRSTARSHLTRKSPPSKCNVTSSSVSPFKMHATVLAQAPVPQASVSPVPRSHTRMRTSCRLSTCTNSAFTRLGKAGWNSNGWPTSSTGKPSTSSTNTTAWGLPIDTQVISNRLPATSIGSATTGVLSATTGMSAGSSSGEPISTVTSATCPSWTTSAKCFTPASVFTSICRLSVRPWSNTYFPTQRMPLPHISEREPSALNISMKKSACTDGRMRMSPSDPMPKWRSLTKRASDDGLSTCSSKQFTYT